MNVESKAILGHWRNNRLYFSDHEKKLIIEDYISGNETKQSVYSRYTGYPGENGKITMWMRKFGIEDKFVKKTNFDMMSTQKKEKSRSEERRVGKESRSRWWR